MRVSATALVAIGGAAALVALAVTDQVLPAGDTRVAEMRPWLAARALGITAYQLLGLQVATGVLLSHPRNGAAWQRTRQALPWHELLTVFTWAFLALHIALLAVDPYADVGVLGALVPGLSGYRPPAVAIGTVAVCDMLFTAVTAKWTRLLPRGMWLKAHRFAAVAFLLGWVHSVLAGTDSGTLTPFYLATGLPILGVIAHRWWTARTAPRRAEAPVTPNLALARPQPTPVPVEES